jgi:hypothetical protein
MRKRKLFRNRRTPEDDLLWLFWITIQRLSGTRVYLGRMNSGYPNFVTTRGRKLRRAKT